MSSTGQPSSSRRKEKDPMERLTPLQEKELENASLRRQVRDFQQELDEVRPKNKDLEAEQKAKNEVFERLNEENKDLSEEISRLKLNNDSLSKDLVKGDLEIDSYKERIVQLQGLLEDLLRKRYDEICASSQRYRLEVADARKVMDKEFGSVPMAASKKAESKERANPQLEQSGSQNHAEELESQKMSKDTTEEEFETVKNKKNKLAGGSGSKASIFARSLSSTNYLRPTDPDDQSDEQSRAGLTASPPRLISSSAPDTDLSTLTGTSGWCSGDRHGFKTLYSQEDTPMVQRRSAFQAPKSSPRPRNSPQPEHVRSSATPHGAEPVKDYAQVAATPARPTSGGTSDSWDTFWENYNKRYGVKVDVAKWYADFEQQHAAKSSKPGEDQMRGVDSSNNSKSGQLKAITHGDKVMQSADDDVSNKGGPRLAKKLEENDNVKATRESKQPGVESTKAKRSFSQSFSEPELSQKKTKTDEN